MKVLQVCAYAAPYEGNFIKSLKALGEALKERGHEMLFAFPETAREIPWCQELACQAKVYFLPLSKARIRPSTYFKLRRIYRENPTIAIVHSHFELYDLPISIVTPSRIKIYWHLHDCIEQLTQLKHRLLHKIQYGLFHREALLLAVGETPMNYVLKLGFPNRQAQLFPNGIDLGRIDYLENLHNAKFDYLMFGWLYKIKGVDLAIKAFVTLKEACPNIKMGIVANDNTAQIIQDEYGHVEGIEILKPMANVNQIYSQTKCFLHVSRAEGQSYALLEAIYTGLPVVCSDIDVNMFAKDIPTVYMVPSENIGAIGEMMHYVSEHSPNDSLRKEASNLIKQKYSIDNWVIKLLALYGLAN